MSYHEITNCDYELLQEKLIEQIEECISTAELDSKTGEIVIHQAWTHDLKYREERFSMVGDLKIFLSSIGPLWEGGDEEQHDDEHIIFSGDGGGFGLLTLDDIDHVIDWSELDAHEKNSILNFDERLYESREQVSHTNFSKFESNIIEVNDELIQYINKHPKIIHHLHSRKFEELVAELFSDMGYHVELTPATRDGGYDIRAVTDNDLGSFLYLVECKRNSPRRPVGVEVIRGLYGKVMAERATKGIIVTSSYFSKPAISEASMLKYHISLSEYGDLKKWIQNYRLPNS